MFSRKVGFTVKKIKKAGTILTVFVLAATLLAACGGGAAKTSPNAAGTVSPGSTFTPVVEKKYKISAMSILYGAAPPVDGTGKKAIEERYNITYDYIPVASGEYNNKLGVTFASGDTPDLVLFPFFDPIYFNAVNSDQFLPLEKYFADSKNYPNLAKIPADTLNLLKLNGHIYGVPRLRGVPGKTMTIRKDWLDKLGLKVPTTYDELYAVMKAFKEKDPDGNGKDDTYGTSIGVDTNYIIGVDAMMDSTKAGPGIQAWVEDGKGGIVPSEFAPNNKLSLAYLAKLYKDGIIPKDFPIRKSQQVFLVG
jgi:putative aldouronate transport system substrate-binding protein